MEDKEIPSDNIIIKCNATIKNNDIANTTVHPNENEITLDSSATAALSPDDMPDLVHINAPAISTIMPQSMKHIIYDVLTRPSTDLD